MARTLVVDPALSGAFPSISDALEVAGDDTVISIAAGTYREALRIDHRRVSLTAAGAPGSVVIDAESLGQPGISARSSDLSLTGLTVRATDTAAISVSRGRIRIQQCAASARYGAGLSATDGAALQVSELTVAGGQFGILIEDSGGVIEKSEIRDVIEDGLIVRLHLPGWPTDPGALRDLRLG
jgi:pectin methylesterase-like acyl-CoA thioesterase